MIRPIKVLEKDKEHFPQEKWQRTQALVSALMKIHCKTSACRGLDSTSQRSVCIPGRVHPWILHEPCRNTQIPRCWLILRKPNVQIQKWKGRLWTVWRKKVVSASTSTSTRCCFFIIIWHPHLANIANSIMWMRRVCVLRARCTMEAALL